MNCPRVQVIGQATKTLLRGMKLCIPKATGDRSSCANVQIELFCSQHRVLVDISRDLDVKPWPKNVGPRLSPGVITLHLDQHPSLARAPYKNPKFCNSYHVITYPLACRELLQAVRDLPWMAYSSTDFRVLHLSFRLQSVEGATGSL